MEFVIDDVKYLINAKYCNECACIYVYYISQQYNIPIIVTVVSNEVDLYIFICQYVSNIVDTSLYNSVPTRLKYSIFIYI